MAKKKKTQSPSDGATGGAPATDSASGDIKSLIMDHSLFFDKLVELIPAKFYLPADETDKVYYQGLTAKQKAAARHKTIENTKKARRNRLDPTTNSSKTTLQLLKESIENEKLETDGNESEGGDEDDDDDADMETALKPDKSETVTYEDLQQRLRRKLDELKAGRAGGGGVSRREEREAEYRKRKREEYGDREDKVSKKVEEEKKKKKRVEDEKKIEKEIAEAAEGIQFGKVKLDDDDKGDGKKMKKRKMTKEKELEMARQLQEAKRDPEKGELVAKKHSWKAAADRASGVKVHDNPKMLKESMQREKRKHKKSVDKWKDRVNTTESKKKEKQDKRKGNIQGRIKQKKMKKIEKREKKLMNRPGFEGRKDGFINGD